MKFKFILISLLALMGLFSCGQHVDYIQSFYYNEKYRYLLSKKQNEKAQAAELLSKENLQNHYQQDNNLGIVFNLLSKNDEAEKSFDEALKNAHNQYPEGSADQLTAVFKVHFNRGVFYGGQGKVDQALIEYQKALDIVPNSIETKTNIELLIKKQQEEQKNGKGKGQQDQKDKDKNNQSGDSKEGDKDNDKSDKEKEQKKQSQDRKQTGKYQPRPFQGDQLSEGDVKKILGELSQQDKKIRAQFDKKEKNESPFEGKNEKDW